MRKIATLLFSCTFYFSFAQQVSNKIFLISSSPSTVSYTHITSIDVNAGKQLQDLYDPQKKYAVRTNGFRSYLAMQQNAFINDQYGNIDTLKSPMGGAVACMAYDYRTNRLFYVPQQLSELRYMDLNLPDPSFTYLDNQSLNLMHSNVDVANQISRMTIAADGNGYALTNDGEHLIKFSTQGAPVIQDLGVLADKPGNGVFVRSSCTSWGGDMVADASGNLFLVTQSNYVFKIALPGKIAEYIGQISGLPAGFAANGAAVDENGDMIVSCGSSLGKNFPANLYKITNWSTLTASPIPDKIPGIGNISDMASSNLLFQKNTVTTPAATTTSATSTAESKPLPIYTIFPNPVSNGKFKIKSDNITDKGEYKMAILDQTGRGVMEGKMNLSSKTNTNSFTFPSQEAKGIYMLLIVDIFNRVVYSQQLIVE
jgi:hypothetical protein